MTLSINIELKIIYSALLSLDFLHFETTLLESFGY